MNLTTQLFIQTQIQALMDIKVDIKVKEEATVTMETEDMAKDTTKKEKVKADSKVMSKESKVPLLAIPIRAAVVETEVKAATE